MNKIFWWPKISLTKFHWPKVFLNPKIYILLDIFFDRKIFMAKNFLCQFFFYQIFLLTKNFKQINPKINIIQIFVDHNYFFAQNPYLCYNFKWVQSSSEFDISASPACYWILVMFVQFLHKISNIFNPLICFICCLAPMCGQNCPYPFYFLAESNSDWQFN